MDPRSHFISTSFCKAEGLTFLTLFAALLGGLLTFDSILGMEIALEPYVPPGCLSTQVGYEVMGCIGLGIGLTIPVESLKGCMVGGSPNIA